MLSQIIRNISEKRSINKFFSIPISEKDIAIDCGANVGKITGYFISKNATVFAFEPNPYAFRELMGKYSGSPNATCLNKGVYTCNTKKKLYFHKESDNDEVTYSTGSSILKEKGNVNVDKFIETELIDLSEFIKNLKRRVRILKIDIEGAECELLKKMINDGTTELIDHIFVETHDHKIPELKKPTAEIRALIKKRRISNIDLNWT